MLTNAAKRKSAYEPKRSVSLAERRKQMRFQLLSSVGAGGSQSVDPVYQLSQSFITQFDAAGKQINSLRRSRNDETAETAENTEEGSSGEQLTVEQLRKRHDSPVYRHSEKQLKDGDFCDRFSSEAFNHGTLAASVMAGKGKECLASCFRRAGTVSAAGGERGKKVIESNAESFSVDNRSAAVKFNRQSVHTAVGITVDAIKSSSKIFDIFRELVNDDGMRAESCSRRFGANTLNDLYPFLRTRNEELLIERYALRLKALEGNGSEEALSERRAIEQELNKAIAVKQRKISEQRKFLTRLDRIQNNVRKAEKLFSSDGFADRIIEELETENDDDGDNGGNNRNRRTLEGGLLSEVLSTLFGDEDTGASDGSEGNVLSDRTNEAEDNSRNR